MNVVFRTDASVQIGTGHVMRCLTLADALRDAGSSCTFVCRAHTGNFIHQIRQRGYPVLELAATNSKTGTNTPDSLIHAQWLGSDWVTDVKQTQQTMGPQVFDWLVVDHYALDHQWEKALRHHCKHVMAIDDLADRQHDCDLLLDQNLGRTADHYSRLLPLHASTLIGPQYALLRPEFRALRKESLIRRAHPQLKRLLITMGGIDKTNVTGDVLDALHNCSLPPDLSITIVMGVHAPWLESIQSKSQTMPCKTQVLVNVSDMASIMAESDLVISAAGGTVWESCSLGLPSLVIAVAENQRSGASALKKAGAALVFESGHDVADFLQQLLDSNTDVTLLQQLSTQAAAITQGNGATLVAQTLERLHA